MMEGKWVHMDSTLAYTISLNHPHYYEQNWGKKYEYVLVFSNGGRVEDVAQRYTQDWDAVTQRRKKSKSRNFSFLGISKQNGYRTVRR
jgi:peptide-N4-(N-acetyl-beta-glucosaminyl)asparagine amidase